MKDLAKMVSGQPMADSRDLVDVFGIQHRSIYRLIKTHENKLKEFGKVRFEITSSESGQNQSMAYLNEPQSILLMTYTKSNEKTDSYRVKLVSDFMKLREYARLHNEERILSKHIRKTLTDAIKESDENERMHGHAYSNYTRMAYKLTGLSALKKEWGKAPGFRESLSSEDLQRVEAVEAMSKTMVELGKQYDEIKNTLAPLFSAKTLDNA